MSRTATLTRPTTLRSAVAAFAVAAALLIPAGQAQAATAHPAATKGCAHHTTGTCNLKAKHPKGATAECKDHTFSFSAHFSGTCSHHKGVLYWFK
ncbi:DUF3761 domain-containing protein [Streptacidiphilus sp. PB12-B1b]|uniref:DUF3761 domain-containing protein n=1 Tax=Streptacidiphilus sp. PB12-B1b TaxID=2705012 RepID=UPI0015FE3E8C|nr:DUF3761 domain-containing protein [Streptacidiphilus sp. PB12-B1b]QMU77149.1 DUF3761 domain-containing protein [Streptacidiphilus sp. PB12-B1b]